MVYSMPPVSWSDLSYYENQVSMFLNHVRHCTDLVTDILQTC